MLDNQQAQRLIRGFDVDSVTNAPLQLVQYAQLDASHESVFETVSDHASLHKFTRTIQHIDIDNSNTAVRQGCDIGTLRYCHTPLRMTIQETIVCWQPPLMYGYQIKNFQKVLPDHLGLVLTEPMGDSKTLLTWRTYFNGRMVGGYFARATLGLILPDLVNNLVAHFGGRVMSENEARGYAPVMAGVE